tara:strand:- start:9589 stop:11535 length:1947 start_codon:yes stop_codon:yes gene_type:complete
MSTPAWLIGFGSIPLPGDMGILPDGTVTSGSPLPTQQEIKKQQEINVMSTQRDQRVKRTGTAMEQAAKGILPAAAKPQVEDINVQEGIINTVPKVGATVPEMPLRQAQAPSPEQVTQGVASVQLIPEDVEVTTADVSLVGQAPTAVAAQVAPSAQTEITEDEIAKFANVQDVPLIQGQDVTIKPGALQEQVTGVLSPEAMATAAQAAGTSLARVSRAKKQLRNAGLSEQVIESLGNNPQDLEAKLTTFTEQERGIVEGLPEEALVTVQLNNLLSGIQEGKIPTWAQPAVAAVEQMLAQRGLEASTVGKENLVNAIIQSTIPLAQSNAQALQSSISLDKQLIAQEEKQNALFRQQVSVQNAQNVFNMDMAQFNADQQRAVNNSKFLQGVSVLETNNEQQAAVQNAVISSTINRTEAALTERLASQNAERFLKLDVANLNAEQQSNIINVQAEQQRLLSNQAAENANAQFNARNQIQVDEFMTSLASQIEQNNANRLTQMSQINAAAENAAAARAVGLEVDVQKFNTQIAASIDQYLESQLFAREQFNAQNELAILQSNTVWRREANKIDTAAQNATNAKNAQNSFAMSQSALAQLWQELRDEFDQIFKASDNNEQRKTQIAVAGLGNNHTRTDSTATIDGLKSFINALT